MYTWLQFFFFWTRTASVATPILPTYGLVKTKPAYRGVVVALPAYEGLVKIKPAYEGVVTAQE